MHTYTLCRRVRDALIYLDLPVEVRPCPKGSAKYRALVLASGGKEVFPYLEDNNTGTRLYESGDIVKYLVSTVSTCMPSCCFLWRQEHIFVLYSREHSVGADVVPI